MIKRNLKLLTAALATALIGNAAQAINISGLYATGVNDLDQTLSIPQEDQHYKILETGTQAKTMHNHPAWIANSSQSLWLWQESNGKPTNVTRTFRLSFDMAGLEADSAYISGMWATDNQGIDILINGVSTGNINTGFKSYTQFIIDDDFVDGINHIDFIVKDVGSIAGFRVDSIAGTADIKAPPHPDPNAVPEPASMLLSTLALGALASATKRRRK